MRYFRIFLQVMIILAAFIMPVTLLQSAEIKRVAILDFITDNAPKTYGRAIRNLFEIALYKTKTVDILERNQMEKILREQGFQLSGCTNSSCAVEIGKILSADYVIIGSLTKIASFNTTVKMVDVQTGLIKLADYKKSKTSAELEMSAETLAQKFAANIGKPINEKSVARKIKSIEQDEKEGNKIHHNKGLEKIISEKPGKYSYSIDAGFCSIVPTNEFGEDVHNGLGVKVAGCVYDIVVRDFFTGISFSFNNIEGKSDDNYSDYSYYIDNIKIYSFHLFMGYRFLLYDKFYVEAFIGGGVDYNRINRNYYGFMEKEKHFEPVLTPGINVVYQFKTLSVKFGLYNGFMLGKYVTLDYINYSMGAGISF